MPDYDHMRDGWGGHMMGGGSAWTPWMLILVLWVTLMLVVAAVLAVRLLSLRISAGHSRGVRVGQGTETPEEMLDRLFAAGEIDEATYRARRSALAERRQPART